MKLNSLELMSRLSKIQDNQAGEAVKQQRSIVNQIRAQARMLSDYRRSMSVSQARPDERTGQALRARSAFISVAESASIELEKQLHSSQVELKKALRHWAETRQRNRVLNNKHNKARQMAEREKERQAEKDLPSPTKGRGKNE